MLMVILKKNNSGETEAWNQDRVKSYLTEVLSRQNKIDRLAFLARSLTKAFDRRGLRTSSYVYNGFPVLHASAGDRETSVALFYYMEGGTLKLFAMGEHMKSKRNVTKYRITIYGQAGSDFAENRVIAI